MPPPAGLNLLDLPIEILLHIIERDVRHEDLENFALCSRSIFELAKGARAKHLKRKKNHSKIVVGDICVYHRLEERRALANEVHPVVVLQDMLADRDNMGDYCKTLMLGNIDGCQEDKCNYTVWNAAMKVFESLNPQQKHDFDVPFSGHSGDHSVWFRRNLQGFYELTCSAIFRSLYKTEVLKLVNSSNDLYVADSTLTIMHETYHDLKEVRAFGNRHLDGECINALRIKSSTFERLLSNVKALRVFYNENDSTRTGHSDYRPNRTVAALRKYASHSLESFTFFDINNWYTVANGLAVGTTSLREFRVLKHAAIQFSLFIKPDKDEEKEGYRNDTYSHEWGVSHIFTLVDMLPPTLETLELYRPTTRKDATFIFAGLREQRQERLPNLRSISIQKCIAISRQIRRDCKQVGIKLALIGPPKLRWSHL
ncbi:MAG: hypothetical protein Q9213_000859 [Squamulea squamosa]